jgi:hypothetical protein
MSDYDPHSMDAMFSRVLARLDSQDRILLEIRDEVKKTNGRVSSIEQWRTAMKARIAVIVGLVSAAATIAWEAVKVWWEKHS